ncbi:MAG: ATP-dependent DNA helicase DinG [Treponema sp.]|nr:ATP-dependent DNA helicase DinG [Treponema sp.]
MQKLNSDGILATLCEGGSVAARLEHFEPRQAQLDLMELIIRCFNEDAIGAAEAGTGVGKSFAYLLPALHFAAENNERVVISTATITLQQQLFGKDIPLVQQATGLKIKSALVKGRGNYLCFRRLEETLREPELPLNKERDELDRITRWAETSKSGGRDELPFTPAENIWSRVCSDADLCMGKRCSQQSRCFVLARRKEAAAARVIVVNHHLLFADLAARREGAGYEAAVVLPPYSRVIIDEAHTIEDAATSFFSKEFSKAGIMRHIGRLYRRRRAQRGGLLVRFCSLISGGEGSLDTLAAALDNIRIAAAELDSPALDLCGTEGVFRFSPDNNNGAESAHSAAHSAALFPLLDSLSKKLLAFTALVRELFELLPEEAGEDSAVWELNVMLRRFENIAGICSAFTGYRQRQHEVMWIERRGGRGDSGGDTGEKGQWAVFTQSPVELAESLSKSLFSPNKTVVCVSATLALSGSFNYWAIRSGAAMTQEKPLLTGCFPSPFPYSRAVLLAVPDDAPLPDEPEYQHFVDHAVGRLAAVSGGSALILFTSYQSLRSAWNASQGELQSMGIRCLKQGDDDRSRLLQTFLADTQSVLFATDSFWEGVDAPGDTLRLVILCRLPFRIPNDPVFEARREAVEKNGGNPFMDLSLPEAVMKFKQGFGRLMRRSSDHGVVAVLDSRLIKKRYGAFFLQSLPETRTSFSGFSGILRDTENFLFSKG